MVAIIGIDTETTPFIEGKTTELKLWCAYGKKYLKTKRKHKITKRYRTYYDLVDCREHGTTKFSFYYFLAERLRDIKRTKQHCIITAFNLSFDLYNLIDDITTLPYILEDRVIQNTDSKPSFMVIPVQISKEKSGKIKTKKLYFIDLGNYTGTHWNLKGIAKAFGLPEKLHEELNIDFNTLPRDYEVTDDIIDYCYRDAEIVYKALKEINPINKGRIRVSASSLAFADIKERSNWKYFHRPYWVVDAERAAFFGGRVEVNQTFRGQQIKATKFDVNSMYPFVMYNMKVPIKFIDKLTRMNNSYTDLDVIDLLETIYYSDDLTANVKANIKMYKDCLPYKNSEGRLTFKATHEYISGHWTIEEFYPAVRDLEIKIESVAAIFLYEAERSKFKPFIDYWYNIKSNSKDNAILRFRSKLMLNSAFGKFSQREIKQINLEKELEEDEIKAIHKMMTNEKFSEYVTENKEGETVLYNLTNLGGVISSSIKTENESPYKSTIVAALVTSLARRKLWEVMRKVEWAYVDTDSISIPHYFIDSIDLDEILDIDDKKLGSWSIEYCCEHDCQTFTFWNKKDYRCLNAFKLKGIPNRLITSETYNKGFFEDFDRIVKPKEAHVRKLPPYSIIKGSKQFKR